MIYLDDSIILLGAEYGRDVWGHIHLITNLGIVDVTIRSERYYEEKHRTTIYDTVIDGTRKIKYEYSDNYGIFINNRNGQLHVFDTYIPGHRYIVVPSTKNMHERKGKVSSVFRPIPSFLLSDKVYILNNKPIGECPHNEYIVDYLSWHKAKFGFCGSKPMLNELGYLRPGFLHFCTTTKDGDAIYVEDRQRFRHNIKYNKCAIFETTCATNSIYDEPRTIHKFNTQNLSFWQDFSKWHYSKDTHGLILSINNMVFNALLLDDRFNIVESDRTISVSFKVSPRTTFRLSSPDFANGSKWNRNFDLLVELHGMAAVIDNKFLTNMMMVKEGRN